MIIRSILVIFIPLVVYGCHPDQPLRFASGTFKKVADLSSLDRGISTSGDVEALLGEPTGSGEAVLPPTHSVHEIWYYEDIEFLAHKESYLSSVAKPSYQDSSTVWGAGFRSDAKNVLVVPVDVRQQILLVFIKEGLFDGYLWSSNEASTTAYLKPKP